MGLAPRPGAQSDPGTALLEPRRGGHTYPTPNPPFSRELNRLDNAVRARAADALLNYETVKYFTNEAHERAAFARAIDDYQREDFKLQASLNLVNVSQSLMIFAGLAAGLLICTQVRWLCWIGGWSNDGEVGYGGARTLRGLPGSAPRCRCRHAFMPTRRAWDARPHAPRATRRRRASLTGR